MPTRKKTTASARPLGRIRARRTRMLKTVIPKAQPECEIVPIYFEVDDDVVSVILESGDRYPLFPSEHITGESVFPTLRESLQQTIATIMKEDMEPEDNGIC